MIGDSNPVTVSFDKSSERAIVVSGSQAANALPSNEKRTRIEDFIFSLLQFSDEKNNL